MSRIAELLALILAPGLAVYIAASIVMAWPSHPVFAIADSAVPSALAHLVTAWWLLILAALVSGLVIVDECGRRWA